MATATSPAADYAGLMQLAAEALGPGTGVTAIADGLWCAVSLGTALSDVLSRTVSRLSEFDSEFSKEALPELAQVFLFKDLIFRHLSQLSFAVTPLSRSAVCFPPLAEIATDIAATIERCRKMVEAVIEQIVPEEVRFRWAASISVPATVGTCPARTIRGVLKKKLPAAVRAATAALRRSRQALEALLRRLRGQLANEIASRDGRPGGPKPR